MDKKFQLNTLVKTTEEFGERIFSLYEYTEEGYKGVELKTGKRFNLVDRQIAFCMGESPPIFTSDSYDEEKGRSFCILQSRTFPEESQKWVFLSSLKVGNKIQLIHRKTLFPEAEFVAINFNKPRYPIRAKIKDHVFDFHLESLVLTN